MFCLQLNLMPAQVEQMAAEHDDLEEMIHIFEDKGHSWVPHNLNQRNNYTMSHSKISFVV
jgi:hypothetical protein